MTSNSRKPTLSKAGTTGLRMPARSDKAMCVIAAIILVLLVASGCSTSSEDSVESACPLVPNDSERLREYIAGSIHYSDISDDGIPARMSLRHPTPLSVSRDNTKSEGAESEDELILELRDSAGHSLKSIDFYVQPSVWHIDPTREALEENPGMITFFKDDYLDIFVANPPNYASMAVLYKGNELEIEEHSAHTPCLSVSWPTEKQAFGESDHILISFEATDADGDELRYGIYYSANGGNYYGWKKSAVMKNSLLSAMISASSLKSSDRVRLAVSVTDGKRSMVWESPIFALHGYEQASEDVVMDSDVFTGSVSFSSDGTPRQVSVEPIHSMPRSPVSLSAGEYSLELLDADGAVLRSVPFSISEESMDIDPTKFGEISSMNSQASFDLIVSNPPDYTKFRISHSGKEISVFDRSHNAPSLSLNGPSERQRFANDDTIALSWTGSDLDGDELDYIVYYSADGGTSYNVISQAGNRTSVNFDDLDGSEQTRLAVSVSDGTRATFVETPVFAVDNHPPVANDDIGGGDIGEVLRIYVLANDIDIEKDFDNESLKIDVPPIFGTASVKSEYAMWHREYFIEYHYASTAIDSLTYSICDTFDQCDTAEVTIKAGTADCTILGTEEDDTLRGTSGNDVICGLGGADTIYAGGGDDIIKAGLGDDAVFAETGDDTIYGEDGDDTIDSGTGDDIVRGSGGNDRITGGDGADELYGGLGDDTLDGGAGNDIIHGSKGDDTIYGGSGDDTIRGNLGADTIYPGEGDDTLEGSTEQDTIIQ